MPFFNRDIKVIAGPLTIEPRTETGADQPVLKMKFSITKTNGRESNQCRLDIWNLKKASRSRLEEKNIEVIIEAGYVDERTTIFKGDLDFASTLKDTVDWRTSLEIGDGTKQTRRSRINASFAKGTKGGAALKKVAEAMGLDVGNLKEKISTDGARSLLKQFVSGSVFSGKTADVLDDITSALGLRYSVQDKKLQFLGKGETLPGPAIVLRAGTGLIRSPERGEGGTVKASSLLNGRIRPGQRITLESAEISGDFRAEKVIHEGDTWGEDWNTDMELIRL